jgi:hypothetical protein
MRSIQRLKLMEPPSWFPSFKVFSGGLGSVAECSVTGGALMAETGVLNHAGLLRPFLASRFRSRYDAVPPGSSRRAELLNKLCHRYDEVLDWRYARSAVGSERALLTLGAAARCYCLCGPDEFDGREVPLGEALAALSGRGLPVLLVCRPGVLAYFEPEHESGASQQYILQRPDTEPSAGGNIECQGSCS